MFKSRGAIFGTDGAAAHAHSRHEFARSATKEVLLFDCEAAHFDLIDGDVHALPPNQMLPIHIQDSGVIVGVLETGHALECIQELSSTVPHTFARSVKFYAQWLVAAEHGVEDDGILLATVKWMGGPPSPRMRTSPRKVATGYTRHESTQNFSLTLRITAKMALAVAPGLRLGVRPTKWQPEWRYGSVQRLFHRGSCILRLDNGGGDICIDPKPQLVTVASDFQYEAGQMMVVAHDGFWTDAQVIAWLGEHAETHNRYRLEIQHIDPEKPRQEIDMDLNELNHASELNLLSHAIAGHSSLPVNRNIKNNDAKAKQLHAMRRHELADGDEALMLFDLQAATFEVVDGDTSALPASRSYPMLTVENHSIVGSVLASKDAEKPFAERVRFFSSNWLRADDYGITAGSRSLLVRIRWTHDLLSPRSRGQLSSRGGLVSSRGLPSSRGNATSRTHSVTLRVFPNLVYAVKEGMRLDVRSVKRPSELSSGRVERLLQGPNAGKCVVQVDNGGGILVVDPKPSTVEPAKAMRYSDSYTLIVFHEGKWCDARVVGTSGTDAADVGGSMHRLLLGDNVDLRASVQIDLNGCNHAANPPLSASLYEAQRGTFLTEQADSVQLTEDRITCKEVPLKQIPLISIVMSNPPAGNDSQMLKWGKVANARDLVNVLLTPSPNRSQGVMDVQPVLIHGPTGSGKTWLVRQLSYLTMQRLVEDAQYKSSIEEAGLMNPAGSPVKCSSPTDMAALDPSSPDPQQDASEAASPALPTSAVAIDSEQQVAESPINPYSSDAAETEDAALDDPSNVISGKEAIPHSSSPTRPPRRAIGRTVPFVIAVDELAHLMVSEQESEDHEKQPQRTEVDRSLFWRYVELKHPGVENEPVRAFLLQAYQMRELLLLLDGAEEAAGMTDAIDEWVLAELVLSGNQLVLTSRRSPADLPRYKDRFIFFKLQQRTDEQQMKMLKLQIQDSQIFHHLRGICDTCGHNDALYEQAFASQELRWRVESLEMPDQFVLSTGAANPDCRQRGSSGQRIISRRRGSPRSLYLQQLSHYLTPTVDNETKPGSPGSTYEDPAQRNKNSAFHTRRTVIQDLDALLSADKLPTRNDFEAIIKQRDAVESTKQLDLQQQVAVKLGLLVVKLRRKEPRLSPSILWNRIMRRTDELYIVAEQLLPAFQQTLSSLAQAANFDPNDEDALMVGPLRDPIYVHEQALQHAQLFDDGELPEACVRDVLSAKITSRESLPMVELCELLVRGYDTEKDETDATRYHIRAMRLNNLFSRLQPSHYRHIHCTALLSTYEGKSVFVDLQIQHKAIFDYNETCQAGVSEHINYLKPFIKDPFRPTTDAEIDRAIVFLAHAITTPTLLAAFILALSYEHEDVQLPHSELQLYDMAIRSSVRRHAKVGAEKNKLDNAESMVRAIGIGISTAKQISISSTEVETLLEGSGDELSDELRLWNAITSKRRRVPLIRTLAAKTVCQTAQYRFEDMSVQHAIGASDILMNSEEWSGWESDASAAIFLNEHFNAAVCQVGSVEMGEALAMRRPIWDFGDSNGSVLTETGRQNLLPLLRANSKLQVLRLTDSLIKTGPSDGGAFFEALRSTRGLQELDLHGSKLGPDIALCLSRLLNSSNGAGLTRLNLSDNGIGKEGLAILVAAIKSHKMLHDLDVSHNQLGVGGCQYLCDALRLSSSLEFVSVMGEKFDSRATESFGRALLENKRRGAGFWRCNSFSLLRETTVLSTHSLGPAEVCLLAGLLKHNSSLQTLALSNVNIGRAGGRDAVRAVRALATGLRLNASLTHVNMKGVELGDTAKRMLGNALLQNTGGRQASVSFDTYGCPELAPLVLGAGSVRLINLDASTAILLAGAICGYTTLTRLDLTSVSGGDELGLSLASALRGNGLLPLTQLTFSGSAIGDEGMKAIGNALLDRASKVHADASSQLKTAVAYLSCDAFTVNDGDTVLDLTKESPLSASAAVLLAGVLASNTQIQRLDLEPSSDNYVSLPVQHIKGTTLEEDAENADLETELSVQRLGIASAIILGGLLSTNSVLTKLCLRSSSVKKANRSLEALLTTLRINEKSALSILDLAFFGINHKGANAILHAMQANKLPKLRSLDISGHRMDWTSREATNILTALAEPLTSIFLGVHEEANPQPVITTLRTLPIAVRRDYDVGANIAAQNENDDTDSVEDADWELASPGNHAEQPQVQVVQVAELPQPCCINATFVEVTECSWTTKDNVLTRDRLDMRIKCNTIDEDKVRLLQFGLGWSPKKSGRDQMPTVSIEFRAAWTLEEYEMHFHAPNDPGCWSLHVWVACADEQPMYAGSSPFTVVVHANPSGDINDRIQRPSITQPSEISHTNDERINESDVVSELEDAGKGSVEVIEGFAAETEEMVGKQNLRKAIPAPVPIMDVIEDEEQEIQVVEVKTRQSTDPWNHLQMKHSNEHADAAQGELRKTKWEAAQELRDAQTDRERMRQEEERKHMELVRRRQQAVFLESGLVHQSQEQLRRQKMEQAIQVRLDVVAWRQAKNMEQQVIAESRKALQIKRLEKIRVISAKQQESADILNPTEEEGGSSSYRREIKSYRVQITPAIVRHGTPDTPRLAAARAARAEAAKKLKAARQRVAAKRNLSKKREARRLEVGALPNMLNNFTPEDLAKNAVVIVQAVGDGDRRVRIAARDGLDRLRKCSFAKALLAVDADVTAAALMGKLEDPLNTVRRAAVDILQLIEPGRLAKHSPTLLQKLEHPDSDVRMAALLMLRALPADELARHAALLAQKLEDRNMDIRRTVLITMTSFDPETLAQHADALLRLLLRSDPPLRRMLTSSLLIKLPTRVLEEHEETITSHLSRVSLTEMRDATTLVGMLPTSTTLRFAAALVRLLDDPNVTVSAKAAEALNKLEPDVLMPHTAYLINTIENGDAAQRRSSLFALSMLTNVLEQHLNTIIQVLEDSEVNVRCAALEVLSNVQPTSLQEYATALILKLDDSEASVRHLTIGVLSTFDAAAMQDHMRSISLKCGHQDSAVRKFALQTMSKQDILVLNQFANVNTLMTMFDEPSANVRKALIDVLSKFNPLALAQHSEELLQKANGAEPEPKLRALLLTNVIGKLRPDELDRHKAFIMPHIEAASQMLHSSDWRNRKQGAKVIGAFSHLTVNLTGALLKRLEDPHAKVCESACDALAKRPPAILSAHADYFVTLLKEDRECARMAAVLLLNILSGVEGLLNRQQLSALLRIGRE